MPARLGARGRDGGLSEPPRKPPKQSTESEDGRVRAAPETIPHPEFLVRVVLLDHHPLASLIHVAAPAGPNLHVVRHSVLHREIARQ